MLDLLDFQSKRLINIIQALGNNGEQLKVQDMAKFNECSEKTVMNDIKLIQNSWDHILEIEKNNEYYLANVRSQSHIKSIYSEIISQSNSVNILVEIFMNPNKSVHYYAHKTNTSITNLYSSIKTINSKLSQYNITISNENSTFKVKSDNRTHFRLFFSMIFLEYNLMNLDQSDQILEIIKSRIKSILVNEYDIVIRLNFYSIYYFVSLIDIKNNGCTEKKDYPTINKSFKENNSYYDLLKRYFPTMTYACFIEVESKVEDLFVEENENDLLLKEKLKHQIASKLKDHTQYYDSKRIDTFIDILMSYSNGFNFIPSKLPHFINRYESFSSRISKGSPSSHLYLVEMVNEMDDMFGLQLSKFMDPLIYWLTMTFPDIHLPKNNRIMVISDHNRIHAKYLSKHLAHHLSSYQFDYLYLPDNKHWQNQFDANQYHRIISTCTLPYLNPNKLVITGDYISTDDLARILKNINKK